MSSKTNTIVDLKKFFSVPGKPVETSEMREFWSSLDDSFKEELKTVDLDALLTEFPNTAPLSALAA